MGYALPDDLPGNTIVSGTVEFANGDQVLVTGACGFVRAERAAGCLLAPERGDTVLLALLDDGGAWVLSVLRRGEGAASLRLPEDAAIESRGLAIRADRLRFEGRDVALAGDAVKVDAGLLSLGGQVLLQGFAFVQTFAKKLGEHVKKRVGAYGTRTERVDDLCETRAGRVRVTSETGVRVRAENADIRAREQLDLDASHIKVG